jgi:hypothetical protein
MQANLMPNSEAMSPRDIATMRQAVQIAARIAHASNDAGKLLLASIIFRYYQQGLCDPHRLADIAVFSSSSRLFRYRPSSSSPR